MSDDQEQFNIMAEDIKAGGVVAWYQDCSEPRPHVLGRRIKQADPRKKRLVRLLNERVKKRESF